jgi:hypothetical protein
MVERKGLVILGLLVFFLLFPATFCSAESYMGLGGVQVTQGDSNVPPVAFFTVGLGVAPVGQGLVFNASESYDPDGSIASYSWDYGDGEVGEGMVTLHVYDQPGAYRATVTVIDDSGSADTACRVLEAQVFCVTIVGVECPSVAGLGETFTVTVTVDYEFPCSTMVNPCILEVSGEGYAVEEFLEWDGVGTEVYTFELTAPDEATTWELEVGVPFMVEESWLNDDGVSSVAFSVEVGSGKDPSWSLIPDVPLEYLVIIWLTVLGLLIVQKRIF